MKKSILCLLIIVGGIFNISFAQNDAGLNDAEYIKKYYQKSEHEIVMRDGIKLYTIVYSPKDKKKDYPIMLMRTCYGIGPYGEGNFANSIGPSSYMLREGYIFVYQDVRGRFMSEGLFTTMTPNIAGNDPKDKSKIDESSDTYDSIDWLIKNIKGNNGKVGMWGVSYPGFYTAAALPDAHPALKASSPQAPIADFFFDDFHHNGAFLQSYLLAYPVFGYQKSDKIAFPWYALKMLRTNNPDGYDYNLNLGPLKNVPYGEDNFFWQETIHHPNYDSFWQARSILPHLKNINHAVMTVGGWFDAEDLYGPLNIYKTIEKNNPNTYNSLVMGPWSHGDWHREKGKHYINHIYFGDSICSFFMREIEAPFFRHFLKGEGENKLPEAYVFDTGKNQWKTFDQWPPKDKKQYRLHLGAKEQLIVNGKGNADLVFEYVSDPAKPVPYRSEIEGPVFTPRAYMTDDQRHASRRTDVLTFQTEVLTEELTLSGEVLAKLEVAISSTDADFVVKIIDVFPNDHASFSKNPDHIKMGGYQMLVRSEVMRGRFREDFSQPKPFEPNQKTAVTVPIQDLFHTFKKGHRLMIQIHSTWFPFIDRNPQNYVENIYMANEEDFIKATIKIFGDSVIEIN